MTDRILEMYLSGILIVSRIIAVIIVLLTSPIWAFIYLGFNTIDVFNEIRNGGKNERT